MNTTLQVSNPDAQILTRNLRRVCLAALCNILKMFQTPNMASAHNSLISSPSSIGGLDKHEQYSGSPEHKKCSGSEVTTKFVGTYEDAGSNLQVTKCHPQNSPGAAQNQPSLRGAVHSMSGYESFVEPDCSATYENFVGQPFGSMPCCKSSLRASAFSQLPRLTPSLLAASSSCALNSGVKRTLKMGDFPAPLGLLSRLTVDMYGPVEIVSISLGPYTNMQKLQMTTPCSARNTYRASNHNVIEAYIMAGSQHTQTHPEFTWRFLALSATASNVIHITATTEREARDKSPAGCVMVFAGRLPAEVHHA